MSRTILIIDDEAPIRFALRRYFGAIGCMVDAAATTKEALRLISGNSYGAAIVDLHLAEGAVGFDLVKALRACRPETKVVMLTAYGSPEVEIQAHEHGVDAFLNKPTPLAEISAVLDDLVGAAPSGATGRCSQGAPSPGTDSGGER